MDGHIDCTLWAGCKLQIMCTITLTVTPPLCTTHSHKQHSTCFNYVKLQ
uniref:Uncharacterized protein n=1 Tax=Anguilla anguilla TaxID=7936 RepID=A0A0E9XHI1_ANGAN